MKIVKLDINEDGDLSGVDAIAFVENPAIEIDFLAFAKQEFESFDDYPQAAREMAKAGIERNKALGNKCATQVGKVRAQQLANGEPVSEDTIVRMRSFLIRQKDNYDLAVSRNDYDACGWVSYALWGGPSALSWAEKKLKMLGYEFSAGVCDDKTCLPEESFVTSEPCEECQKAQMEGLDDACWPGYVAIGTKMKDGREVPNCVPKTNLSSTELQILEGLIKERLISELFVQQKDSKKYYKDLSPQVRDAVLSSLEGVALTQENLSAAGYVEVGEDVLFDAYNRVLSINSTPSKASIEDFGNFKVLYRYSTSPAAERDFCVKLQALTNRGMLFRLEDINNLSVRGVNQGFGLNGTNFYDIFSYKGGANCRHRWERVVFQYQKEGSVDIKGKPTYISDRANAGTTLNVETAQRQQAKELGLAQFASALEEQKMIATPIMVPNKLIPRLDENDEKYYVYFTEETIKKIAYKFNKQKRLDSMNYEHDQDSPVEDVYMVENWIVDDSENDKSNLYGYNMPAGTWFGVFKFENEKFWDNYIKTGKVKGVSAEGFFKNLKG